MDSSHVCLISVLLRADGFEHFRCDRPRSIGACSKQPTQPRCARCARIRCHAFRCCVHATLWVAPACLPLPRAHTCTHMSNLQLYMHSCMHVGLSLKSLASVLKCMGNDDTVTMKADDDGDRLTLMFEAPDQVCCCTLRGTGSSTHGMAHKPRKLRGCSCAQWRAHRPHAPTRSAARCTPA
jgi:hypothetical protein